MILFTMITYGDNEAFADYPNEEMARILRGVADKVDGTEGSVEGDLRDVNGNTVGSFMFDPQENTEDDDA